VNIFAVHFRENIHKKNKKSRAGQAPISTPTLFRARLGGDCRRSRTVDKSGKTILCPNREIAVRSLPCHYTVARQALLSTSGMVNGSSGP
jgi:hypothetical protein